MRKIIYILINLIFIISFVNSQNYKKCEMELVKTFPVGVGKGELQNDITAPSENGPSAFAFDKNGYLYISDLQNKRLVKFDQLFEYITDYKDCYSRSAWKLFITDNNEFLVYNGQTLSSDDNNGKRKFNISLHESQFKSKTSAYPTFIYHENVVFAYLKDGSLISIPNPGQDNKENLKKIQDQNKTRNYLTKTRNLRNVVIDEKENYMLIDNELQTQDYQTFLKYWKGKRKSSVITRSMGERGFTENFLSGIRNISYLGKDLDKNTYWRVGFKWLIAFNNAGELLEALEYDYEKSRISPTIHPSGDIYFLDYDGKLNYLYKIQRKW